jgi:hypothetical protein
MASLSPNTPPAFQFGIARQRSNSNVRLRQVHHVHLDLPEARYHLGCEGHLHAFHRPGYRSVAFLDDARTLIAPSIGRDDEVAA